MTLLNQNIENYASKLKKKYGYLIKVLEICTPKSKTICWLELFNCDLFATQKSILGSATKSEPVSGAQPMGRILTLDSKWKPENVKT